MEPFLQDLIRSIQPVDPRWIERAEARQKSLAKPAGSLGRLEELANRCVAIQESLSPSVEHPAIFLFAGDHGVCSEGVSPFPQKVTAQMVLNFLDGGAAINALARNNGVTLRVIDVGLAERCPSRSGLIERRLGSGTHNLCEEPAMSPQLACASLKTGIEMADLAAQAGWHLLGTGEMGIGNTTVASALTAAVTGSPVAQVVGRGTGADEACLARKRSAVERALECHAGFIAEPLNLLARLGGFEVGAMCGLCLGAASHRTPVVVDGFIATAAAALAVKFSSFVKDYLFVAHRSAEPGQVPLLELLGPAPLLDLQMRLGEGTGAALAIPLIQSAVAVFKEMATFESAGVSGEL